MTHCSALLGPFFHKVRSVCQSLVKPTIKAEKTWTHHQPAATTFRPSPVATTARRTANVLNETRWPSSVTNLPLPLKVSRLAPTEDNNAGIITIPPAFFFQRPPSGNAIEMHPTKRRKLDQPPPFLNKPFRSPLHSTTKTKASRPPQEHQNLGTDSAVKLPSPISPNKEETHSLLHQFPIRLSPAQSTLTLDGPGSLQRQNISLSLKLTQLRQRLEDAEQALQVAVSGQDKELNGLITKWQKLAQEAADDLFADAKDRIEGMGGFAVWRRQAEDDLQRWRRDDDEKNRVGRNIIDSDDQLAMEGTAAGDGRTSCEPENNDEDAVSRGLSSFYERTNFRNCRSLSPWRPCCDR